MPVCGELKQSKLLQCYFPMKAGVYGGRGIHNYQLLMTGAFLLTGNLKEFLALYFEIFSFHIFLLIYRHDTWNSWSGPCYYTGNNPWLVMHVFVLLPHSLMMS